MRAKTFTESKKTTTDTLPLADQPFMNLMPPLRRKIRLLIELQYCITLYVAGILASARNKLD